MPPRLFIGTSVIHLLDFSDSCREEVLLKDRLRRSVSLEREMQIISGAFFKITPLAYRDIDID